MALLDLATTFFATQYIGKDLELNPLARLGNTTIILIVIKVFVVWAAYQMAKSYTKYGDTTKYLVVCFLVMLGLAQLLAGASNIYTIHDIIVPVVQGTGEVVKTEQGYDLLVAGVKTAEYTPAKDYKTAILIYSLIVGIGILYPLGFGTFNYWLKKKVDKEQDTHEWVELANL